MAIRISKIKDAGGRRVQNESQLAVARQIEQLLAEAGIDGEVTISRYYSDRWYKPSAYQQLIEEGL